LITREQFKKALLTPEELYVLPSYVGTIYLRGLKAVLSTHPEFTDIISNISTEYEEYESVIKNAQQKVHNLFTALQKQHFDEQPEELDISKLKPSDFQGES
jgi:hypothetical protein